MPRRETEKENSADKNGEEVGVPPAAIDENTGKENDPLEENGDELSSSESEFVNGESDREKKKDLSQTKNPQQRVISTKTRKTASRQKNEEGNGSQQGGKEASSLISSFKSAVIPLTIALLIIIVAILLSPPLPPDPGHKLNIGFPNIFANKIVELQSSFTNQTDRFWRIIKNRGLAHLRNASPPQPLVLLLAAPPAAHNTVDCFAKKLAEGLDPEHRRMLATIDGREERSLPGEKAKKEIDEFLIKRFKEGHRAALVHQLELLPLPSPLLFHSYCDDQHAPYKHVAIIFTVHLPVEPDASLEPKEAERTVEKYLADEVWAKENKDAVVNLLIRVADTVALMNGEPNSLDTC